MKNMRVVAAVVTLASLAALACACDHSKAPQATEPDSSSEAHVKTPTNDGGMDFVGTAMMEQDGTLVLRLSSYDERVGGRAEGVLRYPRTHKQYQAILDHVGEIHPGQTKSIRPWE